MCVHNQGITSSSFQQHQKLSHFSFQQHQTPKYIQQHEIGSENAAITTNNNDEKSPYQQSFAEHNISGSSPLIKNHILARKEWTTDPICQNQLPSTLLISLIITKSILQIMQGKQNMKTMNSLSHINIKELTLYKQFLVPTLSRAQKRLHINQTMN